MEGFSDLHKSEIHFTPRTTKFTTQYSTITRMTLSGVCVRAGGVPPDTPPIVAIASSARGLILYEISLDTRSCKVSISAKSLSHCVDQVIDVLRATKITTRLNNTSVIRSLYSTFRYWCSQLQCADRSDYDFPCTLASPDLH